MENNLRIKALLLENFKSWYGQHRINLDTDGGFMAIVGANGSGKSNIIDALLFVFGWRARQLRQGKLQDLIHYSEFKPEFAKVVVEFSGPADFTIGRRVAKSGASQYEINGKQTTLEEVTAKLFQFNLDIHHNRFLILQGEVESISMMKPMGEDILGNLTQQQIMNMQLLSQILDQQIDDFDTEYNRVDVSLLSAPQLEMYKKIHPITEFPQTDTGLLEFIETIIGTQQYIIPIVMQAAKVEYLGEYRNKARTYIQSAIQEKDAMNDAKDDSVQKIKKTAENITNTMGDCIYIASDNRQRFHYLLNERNEKESELTSLSQGQIQQFEQKIEGIKTEISSMENELQLSKNESGKLQQETKDVKTKIHVQQDNQQEVQHEVEVAQVQKSSCEQEMVVLQKNIDKNPQMQTEVQQLISQLDSEIQLQQQKINEQQLKNQQDNDLTHQLKQDIQKLEQQMQPISTERVTKQTALKTLEKQNNQKLYHVQEMGVEAAAYVMQISQKCSIKNPQLAKLTKQKEDIEVKFKNSNIQNLLKEKQEVSEQLQFKLGQVQNIDLKLKDIQNSRLEFMKNNQLLNKLLEAQNQNILSGIFGRLGSLGTIDENLNTAAIATAGAQLDYIVCQNMDCIKGCLNFIRQNDLGQSNFIDLEQVTAKFRQSQQMSQVDRDFVEQHNGFQLLDMIQTNDQIRPAFWHIFRQLVITQTVSDAIIINRGKSSGGYKIRVVTTTGEIFESSGALVGGNIGSILSRYQGFVKAVSMTQEDTGTLDKQKQLIQVEADKLQQKLDQLVAKVKDFYSLKEQLASVTEDVQLVKMKYQTTLNEIKMLVTKVLNMEDDMTLSVCAGFMNRRLKEELQLVLRQLEHSDDLSQYFDHVRQFSDYYSSENVSTAQEFTKLLGDNVITNLNDTFISCIFNYREDLSVVFSTEQGNAMIVQIQSLQEQEVDLSNLLDGLKTQLNNIDGIKQYNILRKELQNLQQKLLKENGRLKQLQVDEKRFIPQIERLKLNIQESVEKIDACKNKLSDLSNAVQQLQSLLQQKESAILQLNKIQQTQLAAINDKKAQQYELQGQFDALNQQLVAIRDLLAKNKEEASSCAEKIETSEQQISNLLSNLLEIQQLLQLVEEQLQFQKPLFNNHENQQELQEYDIYILNNFTNPSQSKRKQEAVKNIQLAFPQEIMILREYQQKVQKLQEAQTSYQQIQSIYSQLADQLQETKDRRQHEFMAAFNDINAKLREIYRIFSMGGDATIDLVNPFDPFDGLQYTVMPPKKAWRPIQNLSGGEKTLSSLSLIFSLHQYKQNHIYVVDEIDAALDFRNVSLVANYLKEQALHTQFVIISLRNNTFEVADKLIGVYKTGNCSHVVEVDL